MATVTAVACSAALPIIGTSITPVNNAVKPNLDVATSKESTSSSDSIATNKVHTSNTPLQNHILGL